MAHRKINWEEVKKMSALESNHDFTNKLRTLSLVDQQTEIRSLLRSFGTDIEKNDSDPFGNGDQSAIPTLEGRTRARELFSIGGDLPAATFSKSFSPFALACLAGEPAPVKTMIEDVCSKLKQPYSRQNKLKELLDGRETAMRHSPLLLLWSAGKMMMGINKSKYVTISKLLLRAGASPDCQDVVGKTVVHYGAGMMATDITLEIVDVCIEAAKTSHMCGRDVVLKGLHSAELNGKTGVAGGFDADSGRRSVYIRDLDREVWVKVENIELIDDTTKLDLLHGKRIVLAGLKNEAMNGKKGIVGAFDSDAGRHGVYIPEMRKEVWIKKENISVPVDEPALNLSGKNVVLSGLKTASLNGKKGIAGQFDSSSRRLSVFIPEKKKEVCVKIENISIDDSAKKLLSDVQDRLGSVSLHEVVMNDREDCAKLLLEKHNTSIHTKDYDGSGPLQMIVSVGAAMNTKVGRIISSVTRKEAKMAHSAKKAVLNSYCANCNKSLGTDGGMKCSKCKVTLYCGRDCQVKHWKEGGHKQECKLLAAKKEGVQLSRDYIQHHANMELAARIYGPQFRDSFRIPQGVKPGEKFVIKVQANDEDMPLMIYDETRTCQLCYLPNGPGHSEMWREAKNEPAWGGRKTYMKASWTDDDKCIVYPGTAGIKNKYAW
ncbi:unnamed protein product [Cylindrotheca closterium]|uniref:MYND-type domain-containing protein n=1 Tax=Cylindrotheca closterium TaxID=2856 RepID=A0AAD2FTC3_9STRA|nr:unnamed protein product [Cylindrotheca closterium]